MTGTDADTGATFERALAETDRLLGAVAHQLGGAMLPSIKEEPALEGQRAWRRLTFAAGAMADHLRGQKRALDALRGSPSMDAVIYDREEWMSWFPSLLSGLETDRFKPSFSFDLDGEIPPGFARALLTSVVWLRCAEHPQELAVEVSAEAGSAFRLGVSGLAGPAPAELPGAVRAAWESLGSDLEFEVSEPRLSIAARRA